MCPPAAPLSGGFGQPTAQIVSRCYGSFQDERHLLRVDGALDPSNPPAAVVVEAREKAPHAPDKANG
jgi:hypothetical protein